MSFPLPAIIVPAAATVTVTITTPAGGAVGAFSDPNGTTPVVFPQTVTTSTEESPNA